MQDIERYRLTAPLYSLKINFIYLIYCLEKRRQKIMNILYITYDGLLEPLGQSQVLAYQEKLAKNFNIILFSYEKPSDLKKNDLFLQIKERVSQSSIKWIFRKYHKSPTLLSTFYDLAIGIIHCSYIVWKHEIKIIHARSYPPALIAVVLKKIFGIKFIFDMRGFWADERVDGGIWKKDSGIFKATKKLEKFFLLNADHIVSLTHAAINEIEKFPYIKSGTLPFSVISTCVDLNAFTPREKNISGESFILGYLGTVGTWYLFEETVRAFQILLTQRPNSKILIVNRGEHEFILLTLQRLMVPMESIELISANHADVPALIKKMHATVFFLKPFFSKQAAAPTKLGEFLASGVPALTNKGVGDMATILRDSNSGIVIDSFQEITIQKGIINLLALAEQDDIIDRCRKTAESNFSLNTGIKDYAKIYTHLLAQ